MTARSTLSPLLPISCFYFTEFTAMPQSNSLGLQGRLRFYGVLSALFTVWVFSELYARKIISEVLRFEHGAAGWEVRMLPTGEIKVKLNLRPNGNLNWSTVLKNWQNKSSRKFCLNSSPVPIKFSSPFFIRRIRFPEYFWIVFFLQIYWNLVLETFVF